MKRVCVYCASSTKIDNKYYEAASKLAKSLVDADYAINYGGGAVGLMGVVADTVLEHEGNITGIIPHFMVEVEWEHKGVEKMVHVNTMAERKMKLIQDVDAVIALPGGSGTLEELTEVLSMKKLGLFTKPVILLNVDGFYNPLVELFNKMIDQNFMRPDHRQLWTIVESPEEIVEAIRTAPAWGEDAMKLAAV
ncbi:TIGR00730 family Rossman fold protein [Marinilabiliaceae bacterium JC017]|nr:TIGR00730 family Rossman fold protein [Marinilabiliaceae bacterium JC017]